MKAKKLNILFAGVFALVFLIGFASAVALSPGSVTLSKDGGSFLVNASSTALNDTVSLSVGQIKDSLDREVVFSFSANNFTLSSSSQSINVTYTVPSNFDFDFPKTYKTTLTADASNSSDATASLSFSSSNFCEHSNVGELKTSIEDIQVAEGGFGDDNDWYVFDKVEVEVSVKNDGNEDIDNVIVEWGLYDTQSNQWAIEPDEEDDFDINENDEETVKFSFTLNNKLDEDLEDLEDGDYILYVRATGEIADGTHEGEDTCSSDSETNNLILENDFVVLSNIEVPEIVQCGSQVQVSADVWNIGSDDQNDVYVIVSNRELGINEPVDVGDIDSFESSDFNFNLQLPDDIQEKLHYLTLTVYDNNDDIYENGDDDKSIFSASLNVKGGCSVAKASVTAVVESGGQAGKPLVIKATIVNTGKKTLTYSLNIAGYAEWASSATLDKTSLTLDSGESAEVLLNFNVKKEALGDNLFNLEVISGNEIVVSQPVSVEITKKTFSLGNLFSGENNGYIWGIVALNVILVILIIVIAVRISRKK